MKHSGDKLIMEVVRNLKRPTLRVSQHEITHCFWCHNLTKVTRQQTLTVQQWQVLTPVTLQVDISRLEVQLRPSLACRKCVCCLLVPRTPGSVPGRQLSQLVCNSASNLADTARRGNISSVQWCHNQMFEITLFAQPLSMSSLVYL